MKKKQRDKLKAKKARVAIGEACTQNGHEPYDAYLCSRCGDCYMCAHQIIDREEAGSIKWYRCPDGFEKPSYMDIGQFAALRKAPPTQKGIQWEKY